LTGTPLFQLAADVHNPSPAPPVQESVQVAAAPACDGETAANDRLKVAKVAANKVLNVRPTTNFRRERRTISMTLPSHQLDTVACRSQTTPI
jgi:hypothetical protein